MNDPVHAHPADDTPELDLCGTGVCSECGHQTDASATCPNCGVSM